MSEQETAERYCNCPFLLLLVHLCSTICADVEEVSTNEGEDADDDADEEEDGAK